MDDDIQQHRPSVGLNQQYIKSIPGLIKIAEFILLLIAFASLTGFTASHFDNSYNGRYDFFYFASITTWLIVLIIFLLFVSNLNYRLNWNWNCVLMVYSLVTAMLLLLASSLVLDAAVFYRTHEEHLKPAKDYVRFCVVEKCGNIEAAGAFGILTTILFIFDTVYFFIENRSNRAPPLP